MGRCQKGFMIIIHMTQPYAPATAVILLVLGLTSVVIMSKIALRYRKKSRHLKNN